MERGCFTQVDGNAAGGGEEDLTKWRMGGRTWAEEVVNAELWPGNRSGGRKTAQESRARARGKLEPRLGGRLHAPQNATLPVTARGLELGNLGSDFLSQK